MGSTTYPDRRKSRYACRYYVICALGLLRNNAGPVMGLHIHGFRTICGNPPFDGLPYAELEVIALYSHEHKGNYAPTECIGSLFDKISTPLTMDVHFYRTKFETSVNWLEKKILTLQANKRRDFAKVAQIMCIEHTFHLGAKVSRWITRLFHQHHLDVALELIKFCENRYNWDLKDRLCQNDSWNFHSA